MIFRRALLREFANLGVAVFLTLFLIALTTRLIRLLGQAAGGKLPSDAVFAYLGFFALGSLAVLLSLTVFITVLLTLARMWRDSEMVIWLSCGLSLAAWTKPVLIFAAPLVGVITVLSLVLSPWSAEMAEQYRSRLEARDDLSRVDPGSFGESRSKQRVFFVESVSGDRSSVRNVFISTLQHGREGVMVSERGYIETAPSGDRFLVMLAGRRYEGTPGSAEFRMTEFERYATRVDAKEDRDIEASEKSLSTLALIGQGDNASRAELLWRIGVPLSALILALLAIPISYFNPRAGRSVNLVFALLLYVAYSNLLSLSQAHVAQGKVSFALGWWPLHAAMLAALVAMFAYRMLPLRSWLRR